MALFPIVIALLVVFSLNHFVQCSVLKDRFEIISPNREIDYDGTCSSDGCNVICRRILGQSAGAMINKLFIQFPQVPKCAGLSLRIEDSKFYSNNLPANWLSDLHPQYSIISLVVIDTQLKHIEAGAFISSCFEHTTSLTFENLPVNYLSLDAFDHLNELKTLRIVNLQLDYAGAALSPFAATLAHLTIENSMQVDTDYVFNLFGMDFPMLETLSLAGNNLNDLELRPIFSGMSVRLCTIDLQRANITELHRRTFRKLPQLRSINLEGNQLQTLPDGIFGKVLMSEQVQISLANNPWNCECSLDHLRNQMVANSSQFPGRVMCYAPSELRGSELTQAEFCPVEISPEIEE